MLINHRFPIPCAVLFGLQFGACNSLAAEGTRALDPDSIGARIGE